VRDPNLALEAADTLLVDSTLASAVGNVKGVKPAGTRTDTWPTQAQAQSPRKTKTETKTKVQVQDQVQALRIRRTPRSCRGCAIKAS
jgi:hypothetical protein